MALVEYAGTTNGAQALVFRCPHCVKAFRTTEFLDSHVQRKHPGATVPAMLGSIAGQAAAPANAGEVAELRAQRDALRRELDERNRQLSEALAAARFVTTVAFERTGAAPVPAPREGILADLSGSGAAVREDVARLRGALEDSLRAAGARQAESEARSVAVGEEQNALILDLRRQVSEMESVLQREIGKHMSLLRSRAGPLQDDAPAAAPPAPAPAAPIQAIDPEWLAHEAGVRAAQLLEVQLAELRAMLAAREAALRKEMEDRDAELARLRARPQPAPVPPAPVPSPVNAVVLPAAGLPPTVSAPPAASEAEPPASSFRLKYAWQRLPTHLSPEEWLAVTVGIGPATSGPTPSPPYATMATAAAAGGPAASAALQQAAVLPWLAVLPAGTDVSDTRPPRVRIPAAWDLRLAVPQDEAARGSLALLRGATSGGNDGASAPLPPPSSMLVRVTRTITVRTLRAAVAAQLHVPLPAVRLVRQPHIGAQQLPDMATAEDTELFTQRPMLEVVRLMDDAALGAVVEAFCVARDERALSADLIARMAALNAAIDAGAIGSGSSTGAVGADEDADAMRLVAQVAAAARRPQALRALEDATEALLPTARTQAAAAAAARIQAGGGTSATSATLAQLESTKLEVSARMRAAEAAASAAQAAIPALPAALQDKADTLAAALRDVKARLLALDRPPTPAPASPHAAGARPPGTRSLMTMAASRGPQRPLIAVPYAPLSPIALADLPSPPPLQSLAGQPRGGGGQPGQQLSAAPALLAGRPVTPGATTALAQAPLALSQPSAALAAPSAPSRSTHSEPAMKAADMETQAAAVALPRSTAAPESRGGPERSPPAPAASQPANPPPLLQPPQPSSAAIPVARAGELEDDEGSFDRDEELDAALSGVRRAETSAAPATAGVRAADESVSDLADAYEAEAAAAGTSLPLHLDASDGESLPGGGLGDTHGTRLTDLTASTGQLGATGLLAEADAVSFPGPADADASGSGHGNDSLSLMNLIGTSDLASARVDAPLSLTASGGLSGLSSTLGGFPTDEGGVDSTAVSSADNSSGSASAALPAAEVAQAPLQHASSYGTLDSIGGSAGVGSISSKGGRGPGDVDAEDSLALSAASFDRTPSLASLGGGVGIGGVRGSASASSLEDVVGAGAASRSGALPLSTAAAAVGAVEAAPRPQSSVALEGRPGPARLVHPAAGPAAAPSGPRYMSSDDNDFDIDAHLDDLQAARRDPPQRAPRADSRGGGAASAEAPPAHSLGAVLPAAVSRPIGASSFQLSEVDDEFGREF